MQKKTLGNVIHAEAYLIAPSKKVVNMFSGEKKGASYVLAPDGSW
jgi:hypothetical protein